MFLHRTEVEFHQGDCENHHDGQNGIEGIKGEPGKDGNSFIQGEVDPDSSIGKDGDTYLNTTTYDLFLKINGESITSKDFPYVIGVYDPTFNSNKDGRSDDKVDKRNTNLIKAIKIYALESTTEGTTSFTKYQEELGLLK